MPEQVWPQFAAPPHRMPRAAPETGVGCVFAAGALSCYHRRYSEPKIEALMVKLYRCHRHKLHSVYLTDNYVPRRGAVFGAGCVVLAAMWAIFILRILLGLG